MTFLLKRDVLDS